MKHFIILLFLLLPAKSFSQTNFRVMFYNVENLFDTIQDPHKNDGDFLPDSKKHWNTKKYRQKLTNISRVITAVGAWSSPALVGLCEVENDRVMKDLTQQSVLKAQKYKYIMTDSPDTRGIDVALMYQPDQFRLLGYQSVRIKFSSSRKFTRDILHAYGRVMSGDTIDVFVCHYPSRTGGEKESEPGRVRVSEILRHAADSLFNIRKNTNIIIMGDFNDGPSNKSISEVLKAIPYETNIHPGTTSLQLYNLMYPLEKQGKGSYKYRGNWDMLDQMIVSGHLLQKSGFRILPESAGIFPEDFLLAQDKSGGGKRPKRTFFGMQYEAGFSDHLPVFADFYIPL